MLFDTAKTASQPRHCPNQQLSLYLNLHPTSILEPLAALAAKAGEKQANINPFPMSSHYTPNPTPSPELWPCNPTPRNEATAWPSEAPACDQVSPLKGASSLLGFQARAAISRETGNRKESVAEESTCTSRLM